MQKREYSQRKIGDETFINAKIGNVKLPKSLKSIGKYAFAFSSIKSITIPNTVNTVGYRAFHYCEKLKQVKLPNKLKKLKEDTFAGCHSLSAITIPNTVTEIGDGCFRGSVITDITVPKSVNKTPIVDTVFVIVDKAKKAKEEVGAENVVDATIGSLYSEDGKLVALDTVFESLKE